MHLRFATNFPIFNQSLSAIFTGITVAGAFSTVILSSSTIKEKANISFETLGKIFKASPIYEGIKELGGTLKDWGTTVVTTKDDFKDWLDRYLGPSGLKSGALELYAKLVEWVNIVYEWFRDKFLQFLKNIPDMVENWKKLRFTLFKWGTFLGGGGGSALWAMFGSGDNWGKLAELMGNEEFNGAVEKLGELVEKNPKAFENMGEEGMKEILEKIMEDPLAAKEAAEELLEEQQGKEGEPKELETEEIKERYAGQKGGKPQDPQQALGDFIAAGLKDIMTKNALGRTLSSVKEALKKHVEYLEKESKGNTKTAKVKAEFLEEIKDSKDKLIDSFAALTVNAYSIFSEFNESDKKPEILAGIFENLLEEEFTVEAGKDQEGDAQGIKGIVNLKK